MGSDEMSTEKMAEEEPGFRRRPLVVLVPFPAQGHATPMLHLGAALRRHGFRPILVLPASIRRRLSPSTVQGGHVDVEDDGCEVVIASVPDGIAEGAQGDFFALERAMEEVMPAHFEGLLRSLDGAPAAGREGGGRMGSVACVVVDLLASWAMGAAARCKVPVAGFWPAMLATYRLVSAAPDLVERRLISASGIPLGEATAIPISDALPCCMPALSTADLPWLVGDVAAQRARFAFWQRTLDRSRGLRWLIANTFTGEGCSGAEGPHNHRRNPCSSVSSSLAGRPRVYRVGPLAAAAGNGGRSSGAGLSFWEEDRSCMQWLDVQMPGSVIYVSFGSWVGPIGDGSVRELAMGLEATGRPFLWVLGDSWRAGLPEGFPDRMAAGRGKLVRWAPQRDVLSHGAVGCYLTHCGWNSTMEAMQCKKRLLCYPVAGDQFINCKYIVDAWGIGVRLDGAMRWGAVKDGVERVMGADGEKLQRRVTEMSEQMNGEEGSAWAAAELAAFAEELRGYRAVRERGMVPSASHDQLPLVRPKGIVCSSD
ncbi:hypothetical protein Taro_023410 [Colocasia esculenta]|uniref:Glycosyltransferase n=1 Tax=Colocasia esculenta TaxID=4460 RepID=A0A843V875_COLES|nr:hypothetical protein [Colocasia esculenta]